MAKCASYRHGRPGGLQHIPGWIADCLAQKLWQGFYQNGNTYDQNTQFSQEVFDVYTYFNSDQYLNNPLVWDGTTNTTTNAAGPVKPFVYYFNTTGIMQHNDIGPEYHPTDVGYIKVASHLMQFINLRFGWDFYATGPE